MGSPDRYIRITYPKADSGSRIHQNGSIPDTHATQTFALPQRGGFSITSCRTFEEPQPLTQCQTVQHEGHEKPIAFGGGTSSKSRRKARERAEREAHLNHQ